MEQILDHHDIPALQTEASVEHLAREYNKQDDALMKVSVDVLNRVYQALQEQEARTEIEQETVDPESHLYFIDAFDMPLWHWSHERATFEKYV